MSTPLDAKEHPADAGKGAEALFRSGRFDMRFADERAAKAAGRDASAAGFVVEIGEDSPGSWRVAGRRRDRFPADDCDRYASRLRAIATVHGGSYHSFVQD